MDCIEFDEQVVRLEEIEDIADEFVRVRLARIENVDLSLFEFDLDLTLVIFFLNADEQVYGRFGGRDSRGPADLQSLAGLRFAMGAALDSHRRGAISPALQERAKPVDIRSLSTTTGGGCIHCHEVKEMHYRDLKDKSQWGRDHAWRYPLPDNLGIMLDVDRGNVVMQIERDSPAAVLGLKAGDVVQELRGLPVHSLADAQFALDGAPKTGSIKVVWNSGDQALNGNLSLPDGWRQTDVTWRASLTGMWATAPVYGEDLTAEERQENGLSPDQLAFWQKADIANVAQSAGVRAGDLVIGFDGMKLNMDAYQFQDYVRRNYLSGDQATIEVFRDGKPLSLALTLD